jgi:thiosulfate dehydrogenase [quinone] large subunit
MNYLLTGLRILVGWHYLYEGIVKLMTPGWTSNYPYGLKLDLSDLFNRMADSPAILNIVDFLILGAHSYRLFVFIGLAVRWSSIAGLCCFYFILSPIRQFPATLSGQ